MDSMHLKKRDFVAANLSSERSMNLQQARTVGPGLSEPIFDMGYWDGGVQLTCGTTKASVSQVCPICQSGGKQAQRQKGYSKALMNTQQSQAYVMNRLIDVSCLGMVPDADWRARGVLPVGALVMNYFRARSTRRLRFEHKLWNALALTSHFPDLFSIIGICWETEDVIKVDKSIFGPLLGLTRPTAALFNPQGSFRSHGFVEVNMNDSVDDPNVRYFRHDSGTFTCHSSPEDLLKCKWSTRKGPAQELAEDVFKMLDFDYTFSSGG